MSKKDNRERILQVRLNQEEYDAIEHKFQNSIMRSRSDFDCAMIFEGYIVQMDENELHEITKLAKNIANNINRITVRIHNTGDIYTEDIAELKGGVNKFWQPLRCCHKSIENRKIPVPIENIDKRSNNSFMNSFIFRKADRFSCKTFN